MNPLMYHAVLLPYRLELLAQERRLAQRRQATSARRIRRNRTDRTAQRPVLELSASGTDESGSDLSRAA